MKDNEPIIPDAESQERQIVPRPWTAVTKVYLRVIECFGGEDRANEMERIGCEILAMGLVMARDNWAAGRLGDEHARVHWHRGSNLVLNAMRVIGLRRKDLPSKGRVIDVQGWSQGKSVEDPDA